jgi:xanthine dehydrogenase YagT iron-sulfur-binding subunit
MQDDKEHTGKDGEESGFSRRNFLKGASFTALAAIAVERAAAAGPAVAGPGPVSLELKINKSVQKVLVEPCTTLAEVLRQHLGLTGTKVGCDRGTCSACTVWLDGTPVSACMTLAIDVGKREITTIEGLADGEHLHPVQQAFIEKDAMMCGFCTPGMVMSCAALLKGNQSPALSDVRTAVSGNYCRCGSYPKVFEATLAAAEKSKGGKSNG